MWRPLSIRLLWITALFPLLLPARVDDFFEAECLNLRQGSNNSLIRLYFYPKLLHSTHSGGQGAETFAPLMIRLGVRPAGRTQLIYEAEHKVRIVNEGMDADFLREYPLYLEPGAYEILAEVYDSLTGNAHFKAFDYSCRLLSGQAALSGIRIRQEKQFLDTWVGIDVIGDHINGAPDRLSFSTIAYAPEPTLLTARAILYRQETSARRRPGGAASPDLRRFSAIASRADALYIQEGTTAFNGNFETSELQPGAYLLELSLYQEEKRLSQVNRPVYIDWKHLGEVLNNVDSAITMMRYVTPNFYRWQLKFIADENLRRERFLKYWESRSNPQLGNPLSALQDYYRRIFEAHERFQEGQQDGWKSPRGRIWCLHGPPNRTRERSFAGIKYQIWDYEKPDLKFVFVLEGEKWEQLGRQSV